MQWQPRLNLRRRWHVRCSRGTKGSWGLTPNPVNFDLLEGQTKQLFWSTYLQRPKEKITITLPLYLTQSALKTRSLLFLRLKEHAFTSESVINGRDVLEVLPKYPRTNVWYILRGFFSFLQLEPSAKLGISFLTRPTVLTRVLPETGPETGVPLSVQYFVLSPHTRHSPWPFCRTG